MLHSTSNNSVPSRSARSSRVLAGTGSPARRNVTTLMVASGDTSFASEREGQGISQIVHSVRTDMHACTITGKVFLIDSLLYDTVIHCLFPEHNFPYFRKYRKLFRVITAAGDRQPRKRSTPEDSVSEFWIKIRTLSG